MSKYQLPDGNIVLADEAFVAAHHPGAVLLPDAAEPEPHNAWWMNPGPFKDRLGADGLAIGGSAHPVCMAVKEMLAGRFYVDLKGDRASYLLDLLITNSQPTADAMFPGSGPMTAEKKATILTTPVPEADRYKG